MSRSERIAQQLGMSHGAATGKLKKNILFSLLVRLQENACFKCGEQILSANDLSIEHKQPWEGRDSNLFWNLENVAFSHLVCNRPHSYDHVHLDLQHGTAGMWRRGCRCELCKQYSREYQQGYRKRYPERRKNGAK